MNILTPNLRNIITRNCGIVLTKAHEPSATFHITERLKALNMNIESYSTLLEGDVKELSNLINSVTINETYFFREESQFDFLRNEFFPKRKNLPLKIWCAACSTGEEPLSIYALAKNLGINAEIHATDIDTQALEKFRNGKYERNAFRTDGTRYHDLVKNLGSMSEDVLTIEKKHISSINIMRINLNNPDSIPFFAEYFDMIFLRNVFIYFPEEVKQKILKSLWKFLKPEGIIMFSMNEIASVNCPELFRKNQSANVYYLQKKSKEKNTPPRLAVDKTRAAVRVPPENKPPTEDNQQLMIQKCRKIMDFIDSSDFKKAEELVENADFSLCQLEFKFFFLAMIEYQKKSYEKAEKLFFKSRALNGEFWPAVVMAGFTHKHIGNFSKASTSFAEAINILTSYLKSGKVCYNFTIDFDPAYFIPLCQKNIEEIRSGIGE